MLVQTVNFLNAFSVGIGVGMEVDVRTEIGLRLVVVSSFIH